MAGKHTKALLFNIRLIGIDDERHLCVAAFSKGVAIRFKLRLDMTLIGNPEYDVLGCRVNQQETFMQLDFTVNKLAKPQPQAATVNTELIEFIKIRQQAAGLSDVQLLKRLGTKNINKALRRWHQFKQSGYLPASYVNTLSEILNFDVADLKEIETHFEVQRFSALNLFIKYFDEIWSHRKMLIRNLDYANIHFTGIYFSVAYLQSPNYNIGLLLRHYMNGDWLADNVCCDRVYIVGVGGSPLSGNNTCHGFCRSCHDQKSFKLASWGGLLKAHTKLESVGEQRPTSKTMRDLLNDFAILK